MKTRTSLVFCAALFCLCLNECNARSFTFSGVSGKVVRRENGKPLPAPDSIVYLTFEEGYTINAFGVGPSHITVKRYDYYAQPDQDGMFYFPPVTVRYWSPIIFGHPHYITQPKITTIATQEWAYITKVFPTNANCYISGGTTFRNQPYLIPTNSIFVGKGLTNQERENREKYERSAALGFLSVFETSSKALAIFNQGNAQDAPQGQTVLEYVMEHAEDHVLHDRFINLLAYWINIERTIKEMAEDQKAYPGKYSPNHGAFVYRTKYAFDSLLKLNLISDGMTYEKALMFLGKPSEYRESKANSATAVWSLSPPFGGGLCQQIYADIDNGTVRSIKRTR